MQSKAAVQFALILATIGLRAEAQGIDAGRLTLQRIFASRDFVGQRFGPARWLASGDAYTTIELAVGGGADIVRYDAATGARSVVVPAARLVPSGSSEPIDVEDYVPAFEGLSEPRTMRCRRTGKRSSYLQTLNACGGRTRAATSGCSISALGGCASSVATQSRRH